MKKVLIIVAALVVAIPVLAIGGFLLFFDADTFRPRLIEAAQRATGREFRIVGPLRLTPGLTPTIAVDGLVLANVTGGSAPEMLRIAHAELSLALFPLIRGRLEVASLTLDGGRLLLEKENWRFGRAPAPAAVPATSAPDAPPARPLIVDVRKVTLRDWRITAQGEEIQIPQLRLTGTDAQQPLDLTATVIARNTEALIEGRVGAPTRFADAEAWPFRLAAIVPGARLSIEGTKNDNAWRGTVAAEIPRLDALSARVGRPLPALTGINMRAQVALAGGMPSLTGLEGRIEGGEFAGITLTGATFDQASLQGAPRVQATGVFRGQPVTLSAEFEPAAIQAGTVTPVSISLGAAGGTLTLYGAWPGELVLEGTLPDLAALSPHLARPLPSLRDVTLRAGITPVGNLFQDGVRIGNFTFASTGGDLAGALEVRWTGRPAIQGNLTSTRLDLAAFRPAPAPAAVPATPAPTPAPAAPASGRVIPDLPVDIGPLRLADADLTFALAELRNGTLVLQQVRGHLVSQAGVARLDPFAMTMPGGQLNLRVAADATATPPALQVVGGGQGLDPVALLAALGMQSPLAGRTDLDVDLRGQGAALRALAATATGHLGLAVTDGRLSGAPAQALAQIPGFGGNVPLSCLALRADLDRGIATMRTLFLEGSPGRIGGDGTVNLRDESLAMRFSADVRVAGVRVRAPVPLTGTLASPRMELSGLAQGALAGDLGDQLERALPGLRGALPQQSGGGPALTDCATALRLARGGRDGPVPAPAAQAPAAAQPSGRPDLNNLLRGLLGR
ncbi:MAG: AsmA family protein [Rubritepida sp.]|nr:AsmA family protein [Rubritepida sp.]